VLQALGVTAGGPELAFQLLGADLGGAAHQLAGDQLVLLDDAVLLPPVLLFVVVRPVVLVVFESRVPPHVQPKDLLQQHFVLPVDCLILRALLLVQVPLPRPRYPEMVLHVRIRLRAALRFYSPQVFLMTFVVALPF
jgi:hypothetical protein